MDPKELNLEEIDALLGADEEEDSDDFDALLGSDDSIFSDEDFAGAEPEEEEEEDSLDELLGAIDNDYLTADEQVFLANKKFMAERNPTELDAFFMQFQETLYGAMSGMCGADEFGFDDEMDDMELNADLAVGHEFGSDEEAEMFFEDAVISGECIGFDEEEEFGFLPAAAAVVGIAKSQQAVNRAIGKKISPKAALFASKKKYMKELSKLEKCVKKFNRIAKKVNPKVALQITAGKGAFLKRPFSLMAAASSQKDSVILNTMQGKKLNLKNRRLAGYAKRCDAIYDQLRRVWTTLRSKGKTSGLKPPQSAFKDIMSHYVKVSKKAMKKSGGAIPVLSKRILKKAKARKTLKNRSSRGAKAAAVALTASTVGIAKSSKALNRSAARKLSAIRKASLRASREEMVERRKKRVLAARQFVKSKRKAKRTMAEEKVVNKAMVQDNPYMDAADLAALNRASKARAQNKVAMAKPSKSRYNKGARRMSMTYVSKIKSDIAKIERTYENRRKMHQASLKMQQQFPKGSTPYKAQYNETRKHASILTALRSKLSQLKNKL